MNKFSGLLLIYIDYSSFGNLLILVAAVDAFVFCTAEEYNPWNGGMFPYSNCCC